MAFNTTTNSTYTLTSPTYSFSHPDQRLPQSHAKGYLPRENTPEHYGPESNRLDSYRTTSLDTMAAYSINPNTPSLHSTDLQPASYNRQLVEQKIIEILKENSQSVSYGFESTQSAYICEEIGLTSFITRAQLFENTQNLINFITNPHTGIPPLQQNQMLLKLANTLALSNNESPLKLYEGSTIKHTTLCKHHRTPLLHALAKHPQNLEDFVRYFEGTITGKDITSIHVAPKPPLSQFIKLRPKISEEKLLQGLRDVERQRQEQERLRQQQQQHPQNKQQQSSGYLQPHPRSYHAQCKNYNYQSQQPLVKHTGTGSWPHHNPIETTSSATYQPTHTKQSQLPDTLPRNWTYDVNSIIGRSKLCSVLWDAGALKEWRFFGRFLNLEENTLDAIQADTSPPKGFSYCEAIIRTVWNQSQNGHEFAEKIYGALADMEHKAGQEAFLEAGGIKIPKP